MKFSEYQEMSKRTMPKNYDRDQLVNYLMGLAGEVGELIDQYKKEWYHGHPADDEKKINELGDILHYWNGVCTLMGYSPDGVATTNILKLGKRYPKGFNKEDSIKRVDAE